LGAATGTRCVLTVVALLIVPQTLAAQKDSGNTNGLTGTVQAGPSLFFDTLDETEPGFNVDIYPGYEVTNGLSVELNLGFRTLDFVTGIDAKNGFSYIPVFVPGVRYHVDSGVAVEPYLHGHLGLGLIRSSIGVLGTNRNEVTDREAKFTFKYGAGIDVWVTDGFALGAGVTMRHYLDDSMINILDFNVGGSVKF
jgi:opacity protein-like surface antigen